MVRHTDADDESTSTTRRTRADLRALPKYARFYPGAADAGDDDRMRRLVDHGWLTTDADDPVSPAQVSTTGNGNRLAGVVHELSEDVESDDLGMVVDLMGMGDFVDTATAHHDPEATAKYLLSVLALANRVCEVRSVADDPFEHDGLFAPYFAGYDGKRHTVEMRFESADVADRYVAEWCDGYAAVQMPDDAACVVIKTDADA